MIKKNCFNNNINLLITNLSSNALETTEIKIAHDVYVLIVSLANIRIIPGIVFCDVSRFEARQEIDSHH